MCSRTSFLVTQVLSPSYHARLLFNNMVEACRVATASMRMVSRVRGRWFVRKEVFTSQFRTSHLVYAMRAIRGARLAYGNYAWVLPSELNEHMSLQLRARMPDELLQHLIEAVVRKVVISWDDEHLRLGLVPMRNRLVP